MNDVQAQALLAAANSIATAVNNQTTAVGELRTTMGELQTAITAMNAPAAAAQTVYHRGPLAATAGIINYRDKDGKKHYEMAVAPLFGKEEKFDVEPLKFHSFVNRLAQRAKDLGMDQANRIGLVPVTAGANVPGITINVFQHYSSRTLEQITNHEATYLATDSRNSQDSKILFDLLIASLSTNGMQRVTIWKDEYMVNCNGTMIEGGLALFKVIVSEASLDTAAIVSATRLKLSSLDEYVRENGTDITGLNAYVQDLLTTLSSQNETTTDLMVNLFKGYRACKDEQFLQYIQQLENQHDDGAATLTANELMNKAANQYKKRLANRDDPWSQESTKDQIVALQAQLLASKKKAASPSPGKDPGKGPSKPNWLLHDTPPTDSNVTKVWNSKTWYWCHPSTGGKCSGNWRAHKPDECKGKASKKRSPTTPSISQTKKPRSERMAEAQRALQAQQSLIQSIQEEDSGGEEVSPATGEGR